MTERGGDRLMTEGTLLRSIETSSEAEKQTQDRQPNQGKEVKDSKLKAIFFMNLFAICAVGQGVIFKIVAKDGEVSIIEYSWFRNVVIFAFAGFQACYKRRNPFKNFPRH